MFSQWYIWVYILISYPIAMGTLLYSQDQKYKKYIKEFLHGDYPKFPDTYWTHIIPIQILTVWTVFFFVLCIY